MILLEITAYDPSIGTTRVLRYATGQGFLTRPTELPANAEYLPRLIQPGDFEVNLYRSGASGGRSEIGFGTIRLDNSGGELDALTDYGFDGREVVVRRGDPSGNYPADFPVVYRGAMDRPEFSWNTVTLVIRDRQAEVAEKPLQTLRYAGDNVLPAGVEGVEDLKGKPKPLLYGVVLNVSPPLVNTDLLVYQLSSGQVASIQAVYDGGDELTSGSTHASLAALMAATVASGTYDWYLGADGSYFRLGDEPEKQVTVDATEGATSADRTVAQIARRVLAGPGEVPGGEQDTAAFTALDAAAPAEVGLYIDQDYTVGGALDALCQSIGAYWTVKPTGLFTVGRLAQPSGPNVLLLEREYLLDDGSPAVDIQSGNDITRGLPISRVTLSYAPNYTVQQRADLLDSVAIDRANVLRLPYLNAVSPVDGPLASVLTAHPLAKELEILTLLKNEADAQAEADRQLALRQVRRDVVRVGVKMQYALGLELGNIVGLKLSRFGWGSGKQFVLIGMALNLDEERAMLTLWG